MDVIKIKNLVFEGGGVKGIAYIGVLEQLEQRGILNNIERTAGSSSGAILALLVSLGFTAKEIREILWTLDFTKLLDDDIGIIRDSFRFFKHFGWHKGDFFLDTIKDLIKQKTGDAEITFAKLQELKKQDKRLRDLFLTATNISTGFCDIFSHEDEGKKHIKIADAVRASMSIPLIYTVKKLNKALYIDGGLIDNFPIRIFDDKKYLETIEQDDFCHITKYYEEVNRSRNSCYIFNEQTLGFRLDVKDKIKIFRDRSEPKLKQINNVVSYAKTVIGLLMDSQDSYHLNSEDWTRTIYCDSLGVGTIEFSINDDMKQQLVESGKKGVEEYFTWLDGSVSEKSVHPARIVEK